MWLMAMGLLLGGLGILGFKTRERRGPSNHLGWMSERWLEEHRAGTR